MLRDQLLTPTPADLTVFLNRHLRTRDCLVQVAGLAEVVYHGRAASTADVGAYLLLIKPDGSVQVHAPKGVKPMNWQPKTDEITAFVEDDRCVLAAARRSPQELVRVIWLEPQVAQALEISERGGFMLSGSEKQLQELLARQPELIEPGLRVLSRELPVSSGGIDLYAQDAQGRYVVVELKRGKATQDAVSQLARYVRSVEDMLLRTRQTVEVRGILAAPEITAPARLELEARNLEFVVVQVPQSSAVPSIPDSLFD
ncbi:endonuclease NucS [Deinococcus multiflagellatus]|uniref:Endonuclease NucS n=1 Tax=Deinococcus multiflagellatus TaxID=1656887 RepID=A0ABW1ZR86_9DEIO|nr:endonuclease NucS [Deinococcus multiflagellatus]MBZ9715393.1 endonuclease NucS [Deinococcus multiflagellatus]